MGWSRLSRSSEKVFFGKKPEQNGSSTFSYGSMFLSLSLFLFSFYIPLFGSDCNFQRFLRVHLCKDQKKKKRKNIIIIMYSSAAIFIAKTIPKRFTLIQSLILEYLPSFNTSP